MSRIIDLRTDAVTRPTEQMWEAMRAAQLGWAPVGEDPSLNRLRDLAAELTGKDAALFIPTGSMGNLVAILAYRNGGNQIIAEASSHIIWSEQWGYAALGGLAARTIAGRNGALDPEDVRHALTDRRFKHHPKTAVICLENTHNMAGGTIVTPQQTRAVADVASEFEVPVHFDGARLFNAAIALGIPVRELTCPVDSVMISLCKGLSAPVGCVLCGTAAFIESARAALHLLGATSIPQAGILAAAGIVALETMVERLADDHRRARRLAEGLATVAGLSVDLDTVQTNIVMARIDPEVASAEQLTAHLEAAGVRPYIYSPDTLRFVLHRHISDGDVERAIEIIETAVRHSLFAVRGAKAGRHRGTAPTATDRSTS